jgi:hypothetical protein
MPLLVYSCYSFLVLLVVTRSQAVPGNAGVLGTRGTRSQAVPGNADREALPRLRLFLAA